MFPRINPTTTAAWQALQQHQQQMKEQSIAALFKNDSERFKKYSYCFKDIVIDLSKNIVSDKTMKLLQQLAAECGVKDAIEAMFAGELINETEGRAVLHTALRNFSGQPV